MNNLTWTSDIHIDVDGSAGAEPFSLIHSVETIVGLTDNGRLTDALGLSCRSDALWSASGSSTGKLVGDSEIREAQNSGKHKRHILFHGKSPCLSST